MIRSLIITLVLSKGHRSESAPLVSRTNNYCKNIRGQVRALRLSLRVNLGLTCMKSFFVFVGGGGGGGVMFLSRLT